MKHLIWIVLIVFVSCSNRQNCIIINNADSQIKNITFSNGYDEVKHNLLNPKEQVSLLLDFKKAPNVDGSYSIQFTQKDIVRSNNNFGYYTNGWADENLITIEIKNDTFLIR